MDLQKFEGLEARADGVLGARHSPRRPWNGRYPSAARGRCWYRCPSGRSPRPDQPGPGPRARLPGPVPDPVGAPGFGGTPVQVELKISVKPRKATRRPCRSTIWSASAGVVFAAADGHECAARKRFRVSLTPLAPWSKAWLLAVAHRETAGPQRGRKVLRRVELEGHTRSAGEGCHGGLQIAEARSAP